VVQDGRFVSVGRRGQVPAPQGAAHVDLTGKTVIPGLVDAHSHIGYMRNLTSGAANYTRDNILDHMHRFAYFGVAASQAMGSDFGELPFQLRDEILNGRHPDAARFLTFKRTGAFPAATDRLGLASLEEVLRSDARFPASKEDLVRDQGWKVFDLDDRTRAHAAVFLERLPEKVYADLSQVVSDLRAVSIGLESTP